MCVVLCAQLSMCVVLVGNFENIQSNVQQDVEEATQGISFVLVSVYVVGTSILCFLNFKVFFPAILFDHISDFCTANMWLLY